MERKRKKVNQGINMMNFWSATIAKDKKRKKNGNKGFSLVELIIVIAIMSILAAAIAPAIIRYIEKSRKAVDIETAQTIFEAANLASVSPHDDVVDGWYISADTSASVDVGRATVTSTGHNAGIDKTDKNTYTVSVVAWARGIDYNGWNNASFKSVLDDGQASDIKDAPAKQRAFTDEFLQNLYHMGVGESYKGNGKNAYDGKTDTTMEFRYRNDAGYGKPECWILVIRHDNFKPEVWVGDKRINDNNSGSGKSTGKVRVLYRLFPDPCSEYKK